MPNIFLYGGCVIRDAYTPLKEEVKLSGYVARQSLISAMSPPTGGSPSPDRLSSDFQRRMVKGDYASNLVTRLEALKDDLELLVIDCNVERLGVYKLPQGVYITKSPEMQQAGLISKPEPPLIRLGTPEYMQAFTDAAKRFTQRLSELGLTEKTLIIDAPLAWEDNEGKPFNRFAGTSVESIRYNLTALVDILGNTGLKVQRMPNELAIGDAQHKWGRLPFHYTAPAQQWVTDQIKKCVL